MLNTNESGRSMVEMLGVLAIIGVLSIGGIAGYTQAMRRYRANEVLNAISMLAVTAKTRLNSTAVSYTDAYPGSPDITGVDMTNFSATDADTVSIKFTDENICTAVLSQIQGSNILSTSSSCPTLSITVS